MVFEDSQDYGTDSPVEQGPWAIPAAWGGRGASLDLFRDLLEAATTLKAGYLAPVELIAPAPALLYGCVCGGGYTIVAWYKGMVCT
jgi:hypothetical protein